MTKYVARVRQVLKPGIHKWGTLDEDGMPQGVADMPLPDRVEIEMDGTPRDSCMMIRCTDDGQFGGDTWHENLRGAFDAAEYEFGLVEADFERLG